MVIEVNKLSKQFKTYERGTGFKDLVGSVFSRQTRTINALNEISFSIEEGELIGFIGPNGAGKSTTIKALTGVLYPTSGEAKVLGYIPWKERKKYVSNIGALFGQKTQLYFDVPPIDAFYMNKAIYSIPDSVFKKNLYEMVEILGVESVIKKPTRQLSLGERMKCEFIMCMLHNPKVVFLDEPTIGIDFVAKEKIRDFISEMNKKGITFILTTHDMGDIEHLAQRVIVINSGEIVADKSIEALRSHMGNKKIITLSTRKALPPIDIEGITVNEKSSDFKIKLELDAAAVELNTFIDFINSRSIISDMLVQEPPIESVIKDLYEYSKVI